MQSPMLVSVLICLALVAVSTAMPFYASSMAVDEGNVRRLPQQGVLENMVNEILRVQSVDQINNNHVRRQIFSRKFW